MCSLQRQGRPVPSSRYLSLSCEHLQLCCRAVRGLGLFGRIATIMDNITENGTMVQGFFSQTVFLSYSSTLLFVILFPVVILNCIILASLLIQSSLLSTVRLVLGALTVSGLLNAFGLIMQRLSGIVVSSTQDPNPNLGVCRFILWIIVVGAACRLTFLAIFSVAVLVIVIAKPKYAKPIVFVVAFAAAFLVICAVCALQFSPVIDATYAYGVTCIPVSVGTPSITYIMFYIIVFAIVPLCVTVVMLIIVVCYIKRNTITDDVKIKKAMARFTLFLIIGNVVNFTGIILPAAYAAQRTASSSTANGSVVEYLPYAFMSLSLLPPPILMLIFFKAVRDGIKRVFCCCCPIEKVDLETSKTASTSKERSNETELSV